MKAWVVVAALGAGSCTTVANIGSPLTGQWGGRHVGLTLTEAGGRLEYDCAAGTIDEPVVPDRTSAFTARGTHTPDWGGPAREGEVLPTHAASYSGMVRGGEMVLRVAVATGVAIGPLTLRRGAEPIIFRCL